MNKTVLIYSSHNCCHYIHNDRIVQRALGGWSNKRILFLPISEGVHADGDESSSQHFGFSKFSWFFDKYKNYGLEVIPFYFSSHLKRSDVDHLIYLLSTSEVALLGGGQSSLGMERYRWMGQHFYNDPGLFDRLFFERQINGLYTVGFSAGADQLCEYLVAAAYTFLEDPGGFGLAKDVMVTLHFEPGREGDVQHIAQRFGNCLVFGLPNDSGLAVAQGWLDSGNMYQVIEFIIDETWDIPREQFHIKTRQGVLIEHSYSDGRHWAFNGGDHIIRIIDPQTGSQRAWMYLGGHFIDYWTQQESGYSSIEEIFANH
ncbi:hypothetical protein ACFL27_09355 [candidate division CSSED10-310 bacterium]|uniref:Uncharacterized protein n=1 Tax=candidate division CSSED10-310 bacterium TaxID=2855610 RepID=A0ABV6YW41_UNCC1